MKQRINLQYRLEHDMVRSCGYIIVAAILTKAVLPARIKKIIQRIVG